MSKVELITDELGKHLITQIEDASSICILTSFIMKSGVQYLKESLRLAALRGADIKVCTGDYLFVTQPEALEELLSIHEGVEWNLSVSDEKLVFDDSLSQFLELFYASQTVPLNEETLKEYKIRYDDYHSKHPDLAVKWSRMEELDLMLPSTKESEPQPVIIHEPSTEYGEIQPRFAQIEALEELHKTIEEDYNKALVVMATGLGKTYLAGFFAENFERVLFIAHREEILFQAKASFRKIMPNKKYGIYNGNLKEHDADAIFASIYTLSMKRHLHQFEPNDFDLIIIDEFHHAAANSYQKVLDYFQPKFLLGITATPDRNDNKDVYAICDGNVAFRLDFLEAIERKWLSPFRYFGVYDDTDYSQITWLGNRYDEEQLLQIQLRDDMADKILNAWIDKKQTRTIGFCSSIKQANFLSAYFNRKGYKTISLHSQQVEIGRHTAIDQLSKGELDVIFTVDLFNEGVDIPTVDTLLFVRPTESLTVFTQQIGRGLRLSPEKENCVIIDLIGNYRNADIKLSLFDTESKEGKVKNKQLTVPALCEIDLDVQVVNLLNEMARKKQPRKDQLYSDYFALKQELGRRPTYLELHLKGTSESTQYRQEFKSYIGFLNWADELNEREIVVFNRYENWLVEAEKTGMSKSYKMVVLLYMLKRGTSDWNKPITPKEVAPFFHKYLMEKEYRKTTDFSDTASKSLWGYDEQKISRLIATMPMTKWTGKLTSFEDGIFTLKFDVAEEDADILHKWTKEICEYRLHTHFERRAK